MEVISEFTLKRETFHLAISFVDRFLSLHPNIRKDEFQLLGLSAMSLAAKIEELYPPKISDWARSSDNGYSLDAIKQMEKMILRILKWKVFPGTVNNWVNWMLSQ